MQSCFHPVQSLMYKITLNCITDLMHIQFNQKLGKKSIILVKIFLLQYTKACINVFYIYTKKSKYQQNLHILTEIILSNGQIYKWPFFYLLDFIF